MSNRYTNNFLNSEEPLNPPIMVSVIMLTYNHEKYIGKALDSILCQKTTFRYEIIIGDDYSTDSTRSIISAYKNKYPQIIRAFFQKKNVGGSRNSYEMMRKSRGKYLASCEGDDFWNDEYKLEKQVQFLENHPEYIGCSHPVRFIDQNGDQLKRKRIGWVSKKKIFTLDDFKGINLPGHIVSLVRRNLFLDPKFDPKIIYQADSAIADRTNLLIWLSKGVFYRLDEPMACYRVVEHGSNLTSRLYKDNSDRIKRDYHYTLILEKYANNVLKVNAGFKYHKRELFAKNIALFVLHPKEYDLSVARDIIKHTSHPLWYWIGLPVVVVDWLKK